MTIAELAPAPSPAPIRSTIPVFGIKAEGQSLETVTKPLTAVSD
jgi:hypothetical protein